jgi:hypothetical protein
MKKKIHIIGAYMKCTTCNKSIESENDLKRQLCFKCHVKGVRLGFSHGQENFHGPTIREQQREMEESPRFKAGEIEKIPTRKELI